MKIKGFKYVGSTITGYRLSCLDTFGKNVIATNIKSKNGKNSDSYNNTKKVKRIAFK